MKSSIKNKLIFFKIIILLLAVLFIERCQSKNQINTIPKAQEGIIDFKDWNFTQNGNVNLKGRWEFYWKEFYSSEDFKNKQVILKPIFIEVPGPWKSSMEIPDYLKVPTGYATYRLIVKNLPLDQNLGLDVSQLMPYDFFINGQLLSRSGKIGKNKNTSIPQWSRKNYSFRPNSKETEFIIHVSNFHHNLGGLWEHIILGNAQLMTQKKVSGIGFDIFVISALFIMGLYNLFFYLLRKKDQEYLYFSFICLSTIIFIIFRGELFCQYLFPFLKWKWLLTLSFSGPHIFLVTLYIFFHACYPLEIKKYLLIIVISINTIILLLISFFPGGFFLGNLLPFQIIILFFGVILIISIVRAGIKKRPGAWLFVLTIVLLLFCGLNDVIVTTGLENPFYLMPVGVFIFVISQGFIIALRSSKAFLHKEALSQELALTNKAYSYFVPKEFLKHLDRESIIDIQLGDQIEEDMGILFCDIKNFTQLSESMTPQENFNFLNSYLKIIGPVIREKNGFIDKYIGDAIMALFPGKLEDSLRAGIEIQRILKKYNQSRKKSNYDSILTGIGIHYGRLMLGVIGEKNRMESTAISDSVNLASRIEGLTRVYDAKILISHNCINKLENPDNWIYRVIDYVKVKGKSEKISMIELLDPDLDNNSRLKTNYLKIFNQAFQHYQSGDFKTAAHKFYTIYKKNPTDKSAALLCQRSRVLSKKGIPMHWDGTIEYKFK